MNMIDNRRALKQLFMQVITVTREFKDKKMIGAANLHHENMPI